MKVTREEMKREAIKRLEMLPLDSSVLSDFKEDGRINVSEHHKMLGCDVGALYWANNEQTAFIEQFEQENNALVYHAILTPCEFGTCLSLLCVHKYKEEWERDREDLKEGISFCYVWNMDAPYDSEWGSIGFESAFGGLIRTY